MFPHGDKGWELKCKAHQHRYYAYRLMQCMGDTNNIIHKMGQLFQQYTVDMYSKVEAAWLMFLWHNQQKLWAELYSSLMDALHDQDVNVDGAQIGKKIILPSFFMGSAWYQHKLFQDAMAIVHQFGKPDLFITFTSNPKWKETTDALLQNQSPSYLPDIVVYVFKLKLNCLLHDLFFFFFFFVLNIYLVKCVH